MTQTKKPLIGLTTVQTSMAQPVITVNQSYVNLISAMGGLPIMVTENPDVISCLDGLVIIGGQDLDPVLYQTKSKVVYRTDSENKRYDRPLDYAPNRRRDDFEIALYHAAKAKKIPVLGICRGLQLINVAEGGTLYEELPESKIFHEAGKDGWAPGHFIRIDPDSKTHKLLKTEHYVMSSRHHQGIDRLGKNLRASAWSEDDLVEIFEWARDDQWVMGVQGHIEQTRQNYPLYDNLMADFMKKASACD
ncbi:MAG: gamma-glutamyl-gamma-aminobutyrate hydrolase family protein [Myxococcaceae bacterium]